MNCNSISKTFALIITSLAIVSCSGGGGGSSDGGGSGGGIGGTGVSARGSIDGFGSIFVNGIRYDTSNADISLDDNSATEDMLALGMVVNVQGTLNSDGITGTATTIAYDDDVQGPVTSLSLSTDGNQLTFSVLGISVVANRTSTVFDGVTFASLANNDLVEVSGLINGVGDLIASRIERKDNFIPDNSEIELKGVVTNASLTSFTLAGFYTVNIDGATDLSDLQSGNVTNGLQVEVKGTLNSAGDTISANRVKDEDDFFGGANNNNIEVSLEGIIANFNSAADFEVAGIPVNASNALLVPSSLVLTNNLPIEVEGNIVNGVLIATEIEIEEGSIEISAPVQSVNLSSNTITVIFAGTQTIDVQINNQTRLDDDTGVEDVLTLDEINSNDFLEISAYQESNGDVIATEIKRDDTNDQELQAPVDSVNRDVDITLLGVTFDVDINITDYENANDTPITAIQFFNSVSVGSLVKIQDDEPSDGTADEVEFED